MPSGSQGRVSHPIETLGIIAGSGRLPTLLVQRCAELGINPFIIAVKGQTDPALYQGRDHILVRLGAAGEMVKALRARQITDLVMIGAMVKPTLLDLRPDFYAARFLAGVSFSAMGDDGLLKAIRAQLETREGFIVHGVQRFITDIMMPEGLIGGPAPAGTSLGDIQTGIQASQALGLSDKGQSVLVRGGAVIGEEGPEGTDALIRERGKPGAILVKTCKPQQDRDIDLPTVGPDTLRLCAEKGCIGIALQAGAAFLVDREKVRELADALGVFVIGIKLE